MTFFEAIQQPYPIKRKDWDYFYLPKIIANDNYETNLRLESVEGTYVKITLELLNANDWIAESHSEIQIDCEWRRLEGTITFYPINFSYEDTDKLAALAASRKRYRMILRELT